MPRNSQSANITSDATRNHPSNTETSKDRTVSLELQVSGDQAYETHLPVRNISKPGGSDSSTITGTATDENSACSRKDPMDQSHSPPTLLSDPLDIAASEESDSSEASDSTSNLTEETDDSLAEALEDTLRDPFLVAVAMALKHQITALVLEKVSEWVRTHATGPTGQQPGDGPTRFNSSQSSTQPQGGNSPTGSTGKRGLDDFDGGSGAGNGDKDDQDKRRKTEASLSRPVQNLACPFLKRMPGDPWLKCRKSWPSVHRVKYDFITNAILARANYTREHIYKVHQVKPCTRCYALFETAQELEDHNRQPAPRHDPKDIEMLIPPNRRAELFTLLREELPHPFTQDIYNRLRIVPGLTFNAQLREQDLFEIIKESVETTINCFLPKTAPNGGAGNATTERTKVSDVASYEAHQLRNVSSSSTPHPHVVEAPTPAVCSIHEATRTGEVPQNGEDAATSISEDVSQQGLEDCSWLGFNDVDDPILELGLDLSYNFFQTQKAG
ncbi:hypothetical protein IL306_009723 [Fusarium sp. DS 682]|nr:hypothetical protein IL306_009723 [Fusarium sp. DS 682]